MKDHTNPLFKTNKDPHADLTSLDSPTVFVDRRRGRTAKRLIRDARRMQIAAEAKRRIAAQHATTGTTPTDSPDD